MVAGQKHILLVFLSLLFAIPGIAQEQISFRQLSVDKGLSQSSVVSIAQDSTGFLWAATQNGLNKYDGRSFTHYPYDYLDITRPTYSNLGQVYVDRQGLVWMIAQDKLLRFYVPELDEFQVLAGIEDASFIHQDRQNNYWIGTYSNGLFFMGADKASIQQVLTLADTNSTIYHIHEQSAETLLLTLDQQLIELNVTTHKAESFVPESLLGEPIVSNFSDVAQSSNNEQYIGTFGQGLFKRTAFSKTMERIDLTGFLDPLPNDLNILSLHLDAQNHLWVATYGDGLYRIDFTNKDIQHFIAEKQNPRALHYNDILCIYEDVTQSLWFGTDGAGMSFYDQYLEKFNSFTTFETPENISIDVVRSIQVDANEHVWVGTSGKGLTKYEPNSNSWQTFTERNSAIPSDRIVSLHADKDNDLWIGTLGDGLVIRSNDGQFEHRKITESIWEIHEDQSGRIWLGTRYDGLIQYDKQDGILQQWTIDDGLPTNNIRVIAEDQKGNFWVGTNDAGIFYFEPGKGVLEMYQEGQEGIDLVENRIKSLLVANDDLLWIGSNGRGLSAFDLTSKSFHHYTQEDGLPNNVIYGILEDANGVLWLSSNRGITEFSLDNKDFDSPSITNYNNYAGLATEFNTGAYFKDRSGNLYFGGLDGYYWFNPLELKENQFLPATIITSFTVLDKPVPISNGLKLKHNENTIAFTFSSLQYALPEKNQYQYRLKNYDEDWIQAGNNNFARYSRLSPGKYEFEVKSSNYDGVWNEEAQTFPFAIAAPWYFNTWTKALYGLLFLLGIVSIYRYFKWRWKMQYDLKLKAEEARRFKEMNDYKSKLYTDIAHEFRTPLTLIEGPIDSKLAEGNLTDFEYANFSTIKRNTHRLTGLVDQLLQLAKLEEGKLPLRVKQGNLSLFIQSLARSFEHKMQSNKIDFSIAVDPIESAWYDEDVIEKIVTNLLSNATKYTPENGIAQIRARTEAGKCKLFVANTVTNIEQIDLEHLFERFYQQDEYREGAGVGLALVRELVKLCKGSAKAYALEEDLLEFRIELPIEESAFSPEQIETTPQLDTAERLAENIDYTPDSNVNVSEELPILLLVEDHEEVRSFVKMSLQTAYQVLEAKDGQEGIELALEHVPDIILSDVRMPRKNGIELTNTLKTDHRTSHIPIVLLTAGAEEENELQGLQSGADDFLTKPFKLRVLMKRLSNLIEVRKALRTRYSQEYVLRPKDISLSTTDEDFLNRVQEILEVHLSDAEFTTEKFSKEIGMSRMQLHRKIQAYTGLSTSAFIRSQRLKQASQLLKQSDLTVNEVAYSVGFNTPSYFIKCFKEMYNTTPSNYMQ
ncbi:MAG: response regulator [Saprospiraceae bacterium]|nr:response regulator [Saprospiraceae bacterium]